MVKEHYHSTVESNDPIIKAAFEIAQKAHAGQSRHKIDQSIMYIVHPVMVYELLQAMGEKNPVTLATGLLHDVIEDYEPYDKAPEQLKVDLLAALQKHGVGDAERITEEIFVTCQQMTNPKQKVEGSKRITQVERAAHMSPRAKVIKIADQMCSLIDHLMMPNDEKAFSKQQCRDFAQKADNLVQAIMHSATTVSERIALARWCELFNFVYHENDALLRAITPLAEMAIRNDFNRPVAGILDLDPRHEPEAAKRVYMLLDPAKEHTLSHVNLDGQANVQSFVLWVNPSTNGNDPRNLKQKEFLDVLEKQTGVRVRYGLRTDVAMKGGSVLKEGRIHYLYQHMPVENFVRLAKQVKVTRHSGEQALRTAERDLKKNQVG